jgi:hypothetical protein
MILDRDLDACIDGFGTHAAQHLYGALHVRFDRQRAAALAHASHEASHRLGPYRFGHAKAFQYVLTRIAFFRLPASR